MVGLDKRRLCRRECTRSVGGGSIRFGMMIRGGGGMCWCGVSRRARSGKFTIGSQRIELPVLPSDTAGCGKYTFTSVFTCPTAVSSYRSSVLWLQARRLCAVCPDLALTSCALAKNCQRQCKITSCNTRLQVYMTPCLLILSFLASADDGFAQPGQSCVVCSTLLACHNPDYSQ